MTRAALGVVLLLALGAGYVAGRSSQPIVFMSLGAQCDPVPAFPKQRRV